MSQSPKQYQQALRARRSEWHARTRIPRTKGPGAPAGASRSVTLLEHMPAIGRFVIRLGLAVTYAAPLTCLDGMLHNIYAVGL